MSQNYAVLNPRCGTNLSRNQNVPSHMEQMDQNVTEHFSLSSIAQVISSQFCTHLMAAGVLKPLEREGNAQTRGVFRMDEMYHWARSEVQRRLSISSDSTPSKIDVSQWPPAVASLLAAEKEKQLLEVGKLKREKMEAFDKYAAPDAAAEADYQTKLNKLEEKIQLLSGEIERYQVLSGIEGLLEGGGGGGGGGVAPKTSVTTSTTDLIKEKENASGKMISFFPVFSFLGQNDMVEAKKRKKKIEQFAEKS